MIHGAVKPQTKPWRIHCRFYLHNVTIVSVYIISAFTSEWGIFTFSCSDWLLGPPFFSPVDATVCSYNPCKCSPTDWKPQAWQPWPSVGRCPGLLLSPCLSAAASGMLWLPGEVSPCHSALASSEQLGSAATNQMSLPCVMFSLSSQSVAATGWCGKGLVLAQLCRGQMQAPESDADTIKKHLLRGDIIFSLCCMSGRAMELKGMGWFYNPRVNHSSQSWKVLIYHRRLLSLDTCMQAQTAGKIRALVHSWLDRNVWGSLEGTEKILLKSFKSWCSKQKIAVQSQCISFTILNTVYTFLLSPSLAYARLNWWLNPSEGFPPAFQHLLFVFPHFYFSFPESWGAGFLTCCLKLSPPLPPITHPSHLLNRANAILVQGAGARLRNYKIQATIKPYKEGASW